MTPHPWPEVQAAIPPLAREDREALRASIAESGVRVAVLVLPDGRIIDGLNRWELSGGTAPVEVLDLGEAQAFELALTLNEARRHLGPEQLHVLRAARRAHRDRLRERALDLRRQGWTQQAVADFVGVPRQTLSDWEENASNADDGNSGNACLPDLRISIPRSEHATIAARAGAGETHEAIAADYRVSRQRISQIVELIESASPAPAAPVEPAAPVALYRCLVIDPPWPVVKIQREKRPRQGPGLDYPTMSVEDILGLLERKIMPVARPDGCHVYLWVTQRFLCDGLYLFAELGITYQCLLTWVKPTGMTPYSWMYNTEHVLFGRLGSLPLLRNGLKLSFEAPATRHSEKPDCFYDLVQQASPERRLDVFGRRGRAGFDTWGNEHATASVAT
jgi:N6-adenosine-specific RNA methylase IME4/DNA-binding XRE family transcriptional regulator